MGLPAPLMGLFNLLQFGEIGKEEETIAQIVQECIKMDMILFTLLLCPFQ